MSLYFVKADMETVGFGVWTRCVLLFCKREKQFSIEFILRKLYLMRISERERMSVCVYVCVSEWMDKKKVERQADRRKWLLIILDSF